MEDLVQRSVMVQRVRSVANVIVVSVVGLTGVKCHPARIMFKMEMKLVLIVVVLAH